MLALLIAGISLAGPLERASFARWGGVEGAATFALCSYPAEGNCVLDGDTIQYEGVRIRVADIDAPETHDYRCAHELALGTAATERLLDLLNQGPFELRRQGFRDGDVYGRKLRVIERNHQSLGAILVDAGLARRWDGARHPWC